MLFVKPRFRFRIDDLYVILVFALNLCHNAAAAMSQVRARSWLRTCLMTVIVCGAMTSYVAAMPPPLCLAPLPATCQQQCNETVTISNETDVLATFSFLPNRMLSCEAYIAFVVSDNQVYWTVLQKSSDVYLYFGASVHDELPKHGICAWFISSVVSADISRQPQGQFQFSIF